jgi:uncharacterized protein YdhG (YjbR/CyaY superfamily)
VFEGFLAGLPPDRRAAFAAVVAQVEALVPEAEEGRSYGMPAFRYKGRPLLGLSEAKGHLNLHPFSPAAIDPVRERLADFRVLKGTVTFTPDHPLPADAIAEMVTARKAEIDG